MSDMDKYIDEYKAKVGWWRLICARCKHKWFSTWITETKEISGSVKACEICNSKKPNPIIKNSR